MKRIFTLFSLLVAFVAGMRATTPTIIIEQHFCEPTPFLFGCQMLSEEGTYRDTLPGTGGDSIVELRLSYGSASSSEFSTVLRPGSKFLFGCNIVSVAGDYTDTLVSASGCDSVVTFHLSFCKDTLVRQAKTIQEGDTFPFGNEKLVQATIDTLVLEPELSMYCDSIVVLALSVRADTLDTTIIRGATLDWHGLEITTEGAYEVKEIAEENGVDTAYNFYPVKVAVLDSVVVDTMCVTMDAGEPFLFGCDVVTAPGVYVDTLEEHSVAVSDSVVILALSAQMPTDSLKICQGDSAEWRGSYYEVDSVYTEDSLVIDTLGVQAYMRFKMVLTVNPTYLFPEDTAICQGETYSWHGRDLTATGIYYDSLATINGCDSVYELTLKVNPTHFFPETETQCDSYTWHGKVYTKTGIYYDSLVTIHGCDSVYELDLTINYRDTTYESYEMWEDESYQWNGQTYYEEGIYYFNTTKVLTGCDSVCVLILTTKTIEEKLADLITDTVCAGTLYNSRKGQKEINGLTIWNDTVRVFDGMNNKVDSIYQYSIDVFTLALPELEMDSVPEAICGQQYDVTRVISLLTEALETNDATAEVKWYMQDSEGNWQEYIGQELSLSDNNGMVRFRYAVLGQCETLESEVYELEIARPNADNTTILNEVPAGQELNGWILLINLNKLKEMGYDPAPEDVRWFRVVNGIDNLAGEASTWDDEQVGTGYSYDNGVNPIEPGEYYALIDQPETDEDECGAVWRTVTIVPITTGAAQLCPNIVHQGEQMVLKNIYNVGESVMTVTGEDGRVIRVFRTEGEHQVEVETFDIPGMYILQLDNEAQKQVLKYIIVK